MWSDRPDAGRLAACRASLWELLPGGHAAGREIRESLPIAVEAERLARLLVRERADVWLDDAVAGRHLIAWSPPVCIEARGRGVQIQGVSGDLDSDEDLFVCLMALASEPPGAAAALRLFGFLGYELAGLLESVPAAARRPATPDALLGLHDLWLEGSGDSWELVSAGAWHDAVALRAMRDRILAGLKAPSEEPESSGVPSGAFAHWRVEPDDEAFEHAVRRTVDRIVAGEIFQTNLCRRFETRLTTSDRLGLYARLRDANPARYGAYVELGNGAILSMSPERFLSCLDRIVQSEPIKGTRPRTGNSDEDRVIEDALLGSAKDRAELAMIVDLVRNDLARVSVAGSVEVLEHAKLMRLPTLVHTYSRVMGCLREGMTWVDLLRATFPPGSITGAPKIQAMIVAASEEAGPRGPAMGSIGWIALGGDLELSVAIRTALVVEDHAVYHAGCGIVAHSDPAQERLETLAKARAFLQVVEG